MGTWGHHAFQNDDAGDWESSLEEEGFAAIESALDVINGNAGYVEAPESQSAVAAAETLCVVLGRPGPAISDEVKSWASRQKAPSPALVSKGKKALERILADSELKELWSESPEYATWETSVSDVVKRLG